MKNVVFIDKNDNQYKGNLHLHTNRSHDCKVPYLEVFEELKQKGYNFTLVSDHEIYWDSEEGHTDSFITLPGAEISFKQNPERPYYLKGWDTFMHLNLIKDVTREAPMPFEHGERIHRLYEQGIDSWNEFIRFLSEQRGQLVIVNHPDWSHLTWEWLIGMQNILAVEIYNNSSVKYVGSRADDDIWDACLRMGRKLIGVAGDDSHKYGPDNFECGGGFTVVHTPEKLSREALVKALKAGKCYASMGPRIYDMRITDGVLHMEFSDAARVELIAPAGTGKALGHGRSFLARPGEVMNTLDWEVNTGLKYFRARIIDREGNVAWSQPVFVDDIVEHPDFEGRELKNPSWSFPRYLDELKQGL